MEPGERVDRFVVEARLGKGGMASVYRVRHTGLGSAHALKVLDLALPAVRQRLLLEGRVQAALAHPNIVAVTDLVDIHGAPGLIMEYVPGPSLEVWLQGNRPDPAAALALFRGILDGVGHAHAEGLIHRDLKPGNVLLQTVGGRLVPKVADFGLVKLLTEELGPSQTRTGFAMGTPGYMAPEQIRSAKDVDARADVFALGCILFELCCGARAFVGDSVYDVLVAIENRDHPDPRALCPHLPDGVEAAIHGCLEPDPRRRLGSVEAVRALLDRDVPVPVAAAPPAANATLSPGPSLPVSTLPPALGERSVGPPAGSAATFTDIAPPGPPPRPHASSAWIPVVMVVVFVAGIGVVITALLFALLALAGVAAGADTGLSGF